MTHASPSSAALSRDTCHTGVTCHVYAVCVAVGVAVSTREVLNNEYVARYQIIYVGIYLDYLSRSVHSVICHRDGYLEYLDTLCCHPLDG